MKQEFKIFIGITILSVVILGGAIFFLGKISSPANSETADPKLLLKEDSYKVATPSAKVTLVEFSDYQCPACAISDGIIKQLLNNYQGKINFVFRHFPLPSHQRSEIAAHAVESAGEQGKFLEMSSILFENQADWGTVEKPEEKFYEYARSLNLKEDQFKQSFENRKFADKIKRDLEDSLALGINSTPTFYINNKKFIGAIDYTEFQQTIDAELAK